MVTFVNRKDTITFRNHMYRTQGPSVELGEVILSQYFFFSFNFSIISGWSAIPIAIVIFFRFIDSSSFRRLFNAFLFVIRYQIKLGTVDQTEVRTANVKSLCLISSFLGSG